MLNRTAVDRIAVVADCLAWVAAYSPRGDKYHASACIEFASLVAKLASDRSNIDSWKHSLARLDELHAEIHDRLKTVIPRIRVT